MGNKKVRSKTILKHSWIRPYLQQNKGLLMLVLCLGVMTFISAGALMFTSGYLISKSATQPENILLVYVPIVLVRAFGIARPVFRYFERLASHNLVLKFLSSMRIRLYSALEKKALHLKSRFSTGDLLGLLADDLEHIQNVYLKTIFPSGVAIFLYFLTVVGLGYFSIPFAILIGTLIFLLVAILPLISLLVTRKNYIMTKKLRVQSYENLTDAVMGINDWHISGRYSDFIKINEKQVIKMEEYDSKLEQFNRRRQFFIQLITGIITILMIIFITGMVEVGALTHICIAAFVLVVFPVMDAFKSVPDSFSMTTSYDASLSRLENVEETIGEAKKTIENQSLKNQPIAIKFEDVSFAYEDKDNLVIEHLTFTVKQGEKIALLGKSGAGKSTVVKLLLGSVFPREGSVTLNDVPIEKFHGEIEKYISVLQQKPHLFDSSVMNNIRLGHPDATDEEVMEAARQVNMHDYIISLPEGYQTRMKELGARFSGGERQRIALARILLQNNPIVILDEPTVGLDAITERALLNTIFKSLHGKTILWITHHLVGVENMDRILFIEDGQIAMEGTHKDLLQHSQRYSHLYKLDCPL